MSQSPVRGAPAMPEGLCRGSVPNDLRTLEETFRLNKEEEEP